VQDHIKKDMAKQKGEFIAGLIGNAVFYGSGGQQLIRLRPARVKQTKATKAKAKEFGRISRCSRLMREELVLLGKFNQRDMMYRMNAALVAWIKDSRGEQSLMSRNIRSLAGFELNPESPLKRNCSLQPVVNFDQPGKVVIGLPAFKPAEDILAPRGTCKIRVTIIAVRSNLDEKKDRSPQPIEFRSATIELDYNKESIAEQETEIPFDTIPSDIVLVAMRLTYFTGSEKYSTEVYDKKWMPAAVVGAFYRK
jgi:hypothetical protein